MTNTNNAMKKVRINGPIKLFTKSQSSLLKKNGATIFFANFICAKQIKWSKYLMNEH